MKQLTRKTLGALLGGMLLSAGASATELVYTPVNPSFGGSPLNGAWLLGNAQAQNKKKDPDALDRSSLLGNQSALDRFTSQLESRVLGDLLNGVKDGKTGMVTTDDFIVRVYNGDAGMLIVEIKDRLTGEISEIIVGQN
ncbi:curli production assembly protein CsgF [Stutzerimonas stutzeri]|uniref:Curli production assembly/transport component CsgF n=1 Tax=Stutzerimonas stutzeri TaxID=316 RepID=A0A2S4AS59_STUST|nr:curli assembly protein CsgF [Stutzerimonas stutzeri]MCQ4264934.1 curli assembly protein CsgF [Stutzerimonas stutzeri]POH84296.1 curli production assembly protein CsgF [Stutzerimonas stutzeri]